MRQAVWYLLRALRLTVLGLSWVVVAALFVVTGFHLVQREPRSAIVGLIAVTPWVYMLAWVTASIGLWSHRRLLAALSVVLVGFQVWWVVPDFDPVSHLARPTPGELTLRVFDANISQANRNLGEIAGEIRRDRPEVVTLEELTSVSLRSLESTHVMGRFRYHLVRPTVGSFGMALWSVYPLKGATEWYADSHPELRSWLVLPGGRQLRLDVLHTTAPYEGPGEPAIWDGEIKAIHAELSHEPRPLVAVGDLNTTWYDWHFQALLQLGLRDAAVVAGQGWRMTWPRDQEPVVPYLRIDHVLLSKGVALEAYTVGGGGGSDHHPVEVTLGIGHSAHGPDVAGPSSSRGLVTR